jgi:hypothetical protein
MAQPSMLWRAVGGIFVLINVAGAIYALVRGEPMHAASHVAVLLVGVGAYRLWTGARASHEPDSTDQVVAGQRLDHLQESLDVIAVEVERIGESQRYARKILEERAGKAAKEEE